MRLGITMPSAKSTWKKNQKPGDTVMKAEDVRPNDIVIPVMGPTGVGKSTFINHVVGEQVALVSHGFEATTLKVQHYLVKIPEQYKAHLGDCRLVFVDTPGFDDTEMDDAEVLRRIAVWLATSYEHRMLVGGVIYLYGLSSCRMTSSARRNFEVFQAICGEEPAGRVVLGTTHWPPQPEESETGREKELRQNFWSDMITSGSTMRRLPNNPAAAWALVEVILDEIVATMRREKVGTRNYPLLLQKQLVDYSLPLHKTNAGLLVIDKRQDGGGLDKLLLLILKLFRKSDI